MTDVRDLDLHRAAIAEKIGTVVAIKRYSNHLDDDHLLVALCQWHEGISSIVDHQLYAVVMYNTTSAGPFEGTYDMDKEEALAFFANHGRDAWKHWRTEA